MRMTAPFHLSLLGAIFLSVTVFAQTDQCAQALTSAGRNELLSLSDKDLRAYYFQRICSSDTTTFGLGAGETTKDLMSQVSRFLNINYSDRETYCKQEQSYVGNHQFDYLRTSTVVERALDNWLECVRINQAGIVVRPDLSRERATFSISRGGTNPGVITKIDANAKTNCRATIATTSGETGKTVPVKTVDLAKQGYNLSTVETLSVVCDRTPVADAAGGESFPSTTITISTTAGPYNFYLREEPRAASRWANEIAERQNGLAQQLEKSHETLMAKLVGMRVEFIDCKQEHYQRRGHEQPYTCPTGKVITALSFHGPVGSMGSQEFPSISFYCCGVALKKE